jgi:hypothetical protein
MTTFIVGYVLTSFISGYVHAGLYSSNGGMVLHLFFIFYFPLFCYPDYISEFGNCQFLCSLYQGHSGFLDLAR